MAGLSSPVEEYQALDSEIRDPRWSLLYKLAGTAALITVAFIPLQIVVFIGWPPPGYEPTPAVVAGWFTLFRNNRLLALVDLNLFLILDTLLAVPILLALFVALRRVSESIMALATVLGLVGVAAFFASNTTFSMLSLSNQYAAAATDAQRSLYLAAGQAMIALYTGTAFQVSYIIGSVTTVMTARRHAAQQDFQQSNRLCGHCGKRHRAGLIRAKERNLPLGRFGSILGDMEHSNCPKAIPAEARYLISFNGFRPVHTR